MWHDRNTHSGKKLVPYFIELNSETKGLSKTPLNRREPFKVFRHEFKSLVIRQKGESQNGCFKKAKQTKILRALFSGGSTYLLGNKY